MRVKTSIQETLKGIQSSEGLLLARAINELVDELTVKQSAKVRNILHKELGSVAFGDEFRGVGKTTSIFELAWSDVNAWVFVGNAPQKDLHFSLGIDKICEQYGKYYMRADLLASFQGRVHSRYDKSLQGLKQPKIIYLDEVDSRTYQTIKNMFQYADIRGFVNG